jgi:hypothetical protein
MATGLRLPDRPLTPVEVGNAIEAMLTENERILGLEVEPQGMSNVVRLGKIMNEKRPITPELYDATATIGMPRGFPLNHGPADEQR